jgi:oxaloacetate decarboxylase (Na+ extruding) subunit alpha
VVIRSQSEATLNVERVEALAKLLQGSRAQELVVETREWRVGLRKAPAAHVHEAAARPAALPSAPAEEPESGDRWIIAPLVGIFRQATTRLMPGDEVSEGQVVGAIESMKILNPLVSDMDGEVMEVLVEEGQPVEYGHPLVQIRPR